MHNLFQLQISITEEFFIYETSYKIDVWLVHRNAELEKEKAIVQAKLEKEAALNKYRIAKMLMEQQMEDQFLDRCDAKCQTICFNQ